MPRGDKSAYSQKQQRQAEHIEEGYETRGTPRGEAARRAWATVNKMTGGGKKRGSGRGRRTNRSPARKGGRIGSSHVSPAARVRAGRKAARTRKSRAR
jgi:plasmid stabilization system protein ParE